MNWIKDRVPENNHDVMVSPTYDEQARIGFYVEHKSPFGAYGKWYVWEGDERVEYTPAYIEGWAPLPTTIFALNRDGSNTAVADLIKAAEFCEDLLMRYSIDRIDGEEIADTALKVLRSALARANGESA